MIYLTQLIYLNEGMAHIFDAFEDVAIPIIANYNGQLLLRIWPEKQSFIEHHIDQPYEIHLISFETERDFEMFKDDTERKKHLHLKEQSIKSVMLIKGIAI